MKTFKELLEAPGAPAADNVPEPDRDDEVKDYKPRSKGEEQIANLHLVSKIDHPVAEPHQFNGEIKGIGTSGPEEHVGGKGQHGPAHSLEKVKEDVEEDENMVSFSEWVSKQNTDTLEEEVKDGD